MFYENCIFGQKVAFCHSVQVGTAIKILKRYYKKQPIFLVIFSYMVIFLFLLFAYYHKIDDAGCPSKTVLAAIMRKYLFTFLGASKPQSGEVEKINYHYENECFLEFILENIHVSGQ